MGMGKRLRHASVLGTGHCVVHTKATSSKKPVEEQTTGMPAMACFFQMAQVAETHNHGSTRKQSGQYLSPGFWRLLVRSSFMPPICSLAWTQSTLETCNCQDSSPTLHPTFSGHSTLQLLPSKEGKAWQPRWALCAWKMALTTLLTEMLLLQYSAVLSPPCVHTQVPEVSPRQPWPSCPILLLYLLNNSFERGGLMSHTCTK